MLIALLATVIVTVAACSGDIAGSGSPPVPATTGISAGATPASTALAAPPTPSPAPTPDLGAAWAPVTGAGALARPFVNLAVHDVTGYPGGFVAVGDDALGGGVWISPDGIDWARRSEADGVFAGAFVGGVTWTGEELIAVGSAGSVPLADGSDPGPSVRAWSSPDGTTWTALELPNADGRAATAVTAGAAGVLVLGFGGVATVAWLRAADGRWHSEDVTWPTQGIIVNDLAASADGFVAVGTTYRSDPATGTAVTTAAAWASGNGLGWEPVTVERALDDSALTSILAVGADLVAIGSIGPSTVSWRSTGAPSLAILQADGLPALGTMAVNGPVAVGLATGRSDDVRGTPLVAYRMPGGSSGEVPSPSPSSGVCPGGASPDLPTIMLVNPAARPACFGDRDLVFTATTHDCGGCGGTCGPGSWLACALDNRTGISVSPVPGLPGRVTSLGAQVQPGTTMPAVLEGLRARITGHFDDREAARCGALEQACRETFVITGIQPAAP